MPSPALVVASIALIAALTGSAIALPGKSKVQRNDIRKNAVTGPKIRNNAVTGRDVREKTLGEVPRAATAGSADSAATLAGSPPSAFGSRLFAVVEGADGSLHSGAGVVSTSGSDGTYQVKFDRDLSQCAAIGALSDMDLGTSQPLGGTVSVGLGDFEGTDPTTLYVVTRSGGGSAGITARDFAIRVDC